jgi:hypothetical protein
LVFCVTGHCGPRPLPVSIGPKGKAALCVVQENHNKEVVKDAQGRLSHDTVHTVRADAHQRGGMTKHARPLP